MRWVAEVGGVLLLAGAAALWWLPLGVAVLGIYLVVTANTGGGDDRMRP